MGCTRGVVYTGETVVVGVIEGVVVVVAFVGVTVVVVDVEGGPIVTKGAEEFAAVVTVVGDDGDSPTVVTVVGEDEVEGEDVGAFITVVIYPDWAGDVTVVAESAFEAVGLITVVYVVPPVPVVVAWSPLPEVTVVVVVVVDDAGDVGTVV